MVTLFIIMALILTSCCSSSQQREEISFTPNFKAMPPVVIYKTKGNYNDLVPVGFDSASGRIISYPAPTDIKIGGELMTPLKLRDGFLLDRRGIGPNSVFLDITYSEYAAYAGSPDADTLVRHIRFRSPFEAIYNCGCAYSYKNPEKQINEIIKKNRLDIFRKIK